MFLVEPTAHVNTSAHSPLSPGAGQKPFPRVCSYLAARAARRPQSPSVNPEGDGALEKVWPHQKTKTKTNNQRQERDRAKQRASGQPNPETQERRSEAAEKASCNALATKNSRQILVGRGKTPNDLREQAAPKNKRNKTYPPRGQKTNRVLCGNLSLILAWPRKMRKREKKRAPQPLRTNYPDN